MTTEKAEKIQRIYDWVRLLIVVLFLAFVIVGAACAQTGKPDVHGILRGKYEYQPEMDAGRFEVRNARLSVSGADDVAGVRTDDKILERRYL